MLASEALVGSETSQGTSIENFWVSGIDAIIALNAQGLNDNLMI